jgi:hypothetical protein
MNRQSSHLIVLPEDDADRQIVNGFIQGSSIDQRRIQATNVAGGWCKAEDIIHEEYLAYLQRYPKGHLVLLIDFDKNTNRGENIRKKIPANLASRIFVIGTLGTPEKLKAELSLNTFEAIGEKAFADCRDPERLENPAGTIWEHSRLKHNLMEIQRLHAAVSHFLFIP